MSDILLAHQQSEERKEVAIERAAARKAEAEAEGKAAEEEAPAVEETAEQKVDRFLATYRRKESVNG